MSTIVYFKSFEKIKKWFENLSVVLKKNARDTGRQLTHEAEKLAKERVRSPNIKPGKGEGVYFQSIQSGFKEGTFSFLGSLKSDFPVAGIIEFGSRPHIIRSKNNKNLFWPGAKHPVKKVKHPGTPAYRVLGNAVEDAARELEIKFNHEIKKQFGS